MSAPSTVPGRSWLMAWLDEHGVRSAKDVDRLLAASKRQLELRSLLNEVPFAAPPPDPAAVAAIAAGASLDLSGGMGGCLASKCLKQELDALLLRTWHYFDSLMVVGPSAYHIAQVYDADRERGLTLVKEFSELLLYIRDIGAEPYLSFGEKRPPCPPQPQHAAEAGMAEVLEDDSKWVERLVPDAQCQIEWEEPGQSCRTGHWRFALIHPIFEHTRWGTVHISKRSSYDQVVRAILADLYRDALAHLTSDIEFARLTNSALGAGARIHEELLDRPSRARPSELAMAYEIPIPFVEGVTPKDIIRLRTREAASFDVFRSALRTAIKERLAAEDSSPTSSVAAEIAIDVIDPALAKIENELSAAGRLLAKGAGLSVGVATVATTVGLLAGAPIVVGPLVGAAVAGADLKKYWADKKEVEISDMYFLWRLMRHAHKR